MTSTHLRDKAHYFKGMLWSSGGNIAAMMASLITVMVAARILTKEELGAFFLIMVIAQFSVSLGDIGLRNAAIRFLSLCEKDELINFSRYLVTINVIASSIVCLILSIALPFLMELWPSTNFDNIAWYSIPVVFLLNNYQMGLSVLGGHKLFSSMSIISASIEIIRMSISVGALYLGYGANGLLFSMMMSRIIGIVVIMYKLPVCIKPNFRHERSKEVLNFGGWMYGTSLISILNVKTADVVLTTYLGTAALAAFTTAMQIPGMAQKVFESVRPVLLGYVSSLKLEAIETSVIAVRLLAAILSIGAAILIMLSDILMVLIFSSKYESSVPIMQLLSTWMAVGIVNYYLAITMIGMGNTRKAFILSIPQFIIMCVSSLLLVPTYHGVGAAVSLIVTSMFGNIISSWLVSSGDCNVFFRINLAYLRSTVPLFILLIVVILLEPSFLMTLLLTGIMIMSLFMLGAVTMKDINMIIGRKLIKNK